VFSIRKQASSKNWTPERLISFNINLCNQLQLQRGKNHKPWW